MLLGCCYDERTERKREFHGLKCWSRAATGRTIMVCLLFPVYVLFYFEVPRILSSCALAPAISYVYQLCLIAPDICRVFFMHLSHALLYFTIVLC